MHRIDCDRFFPVLPLPGQTAYDLSMGYEAIYVEYFKSGFCLPLSEPLRQILEIYKLRLPQIMPNGLKVAVYFLLY